MESPLIVIAEAIDSARIAANQNEITARQTGVYGNLANALKDTIQHITLDWGRTNDVYQSILDGNTVAEALKVSAP
jgi:hypothetical protein